MPNHTFFSNFITLGCLAVEAQTVITLRMMGMSGLWPVTAGENNRMFREKASALMASQIGMTKAAMSLQNPQDVVAAGLKPYRRKTRSNARRLTRR